MCECRRSCVGCACLLAGKGHYTATFRLLFGDVPVRIRLCFTGCGTRAILPVLSRDGIRTDGNISIVGARGKAEGLACSARRSRVDGLCGQPW